MTRNTTISLLLCTGLVLAACGDSGTGPGSAALGTASVQITGSVNKSFTGPAVSARVGLFDGSQLYFVLMEDHAATADVEIAWQGGRPAPGTYTLGEAGAPVSAEISIYQGEGFWQFGTVSGQVSITGSTAQGIQGTANFTALGGGLDGFGEIQVGEVQVNASFNARCMAVPGTFICD